MIDYSSFSLYYKETFVNLLKTLKTMDALEDGLRFKIYNECGFISNLLVTSKEIHKFCIESEEYKMKKAEKDCDDLYDLISEKFTEVLYCQRYRNKNSIHKQNIQKISKKISNLVKKSNIYWNIIFLRFLHHQYIETDSYSRSFGDYFRNHNIGKELLKILKNINKYFHQDILTYLDLDDETIQFYELFVEFFSHK